MQTMKLEIDDKFFPHFKAIIDSLVNDHKVEIIGIDSYDHENNYPQNVVVNSTEEVRQRVNEAEQEEGLSEAEYEERMDRFFKEELGIER
jgi:hypothetical protein